MVQDNALPVFALCLAGDIDSAEDEGAGDEGTEHEYISAEQHICRAAALEHYQGEDVHPVYDTDDECRHYSSASQHKYPSGEGDEQSCRDLSDIAGYEDGDCRCHDDSERVAELSEGCENGSVDEDLAHYREQDY